MDQMLHPLDIQSPKKPRWNMVNPFPTSALIRQKAVSGLNKATSQ